MGGVGGASATEHPERSLQGSHGAQGFANGPGARGTEAGEGLRLKGCRWETTRCRDKTIWLPSEPLPILGLPCTLSQPTVLQSG